jgi:putative peptide zinc metalloprotease protein
MLADGTVSGKAEARPKLLEDVAVWLFFERRSGSESTYIVGSISTDRYLTIPESKLSVVRSFMERLDGRRSLDEIEQELLREHGVRMNVEALHRKFDRAGLLVDGVGPRAGDIETMSATAVRLSIDRLLHFLLRLAPMGKPALYAGLITMAVALGLFSFDPASRSAMKMSFAIDWNSLWTMQLFVPLALVSVLAHELSHCFAAASWGLLAGTLRLQLYLGVIPIVGLKFAGLYTLPSRGRLAVWSAGVFTNLSIMAAALVAMSIWFRGSAALELLAAINWLLAILNLVPLLPTDGYFILSTLTKDPNVRVRAWDWLRRPFRSGGTRPSWFVLAYVVSTVWLLLSTFWIHLWRIADTREQYPWWQSLLSLCILTLLAVTLVRVYRRRGESE